MTPIKITDVYIDGPLYLQDMRMLDNRWGATTNTYSWSQDMLTFETFVVIVPDTVISIISALVAIFLVTFLVIGAPRIAFIVVISVALVNLFLLALIPMWDLTFNNIVVVHLVAGMGLSVYFSLIIGHTFLLVEPP